MGPSRARCRLHHCARSAQKAPVARGVPFQGSALTRPCFAALFCDDAAVLLSGLSRSPNVARRPSIRRWCASGADGSLISERAALTIMRRSTCCPATSSMPCSHRDAVSTATTASIRSGCCARLHEPSCPTVPPGRLDADAAARKNLYLTSDRTVAASSRSCARRLARGTAF